MWGGRGAALGAVALLPRSSAACCRCSSARCSARPRRTCRSTSSRRSSSRRSRCAIAARRARWRSASWSGVGIGTVGLAPSGPGRTSGCRCPWPSELLPEASSSASLAAVAGSRARRLDRPPPDRRRRSRRIPRAAHGAVARRRRDRRAASASRSTSRPTRACAPRSRSPTSRGGARARGAGRRDARPARRRRRRRVADRSPPGRATASSSTGSSASAPAATAPPSRSRCTATGRRSIRLHDGNSLTAVPIFLPARRGHPGQGGARPRRSFERTFVADHEILQREQKSAAPAAHRAWRTRWSSRSRCRCSRCWPGACTGSGRWAGRPPPRRQSASARLPPGALPAT